MKFSTTIFEFSIVASFVHSSLRTDDLINSVSSLGQEKENVGNGMAIFLSLLSTNTRTHSVQIQSDNFITSYSPSDHKQEIQGYDETNSHLWLNSTIHLPDSADHWWSIRTNNKVYVDKTDVLEYIINLGKIINFCARPRRFGKTLFAQTIKSYFTGEKHLFDKLKITKLRQGNIIHSKPNGSWIRYPIIHIDFSVIHHMISYSTHEMVIDFQKNLRSMLNDIAAEHGLREKDERTLTGLISELERKYKLPTIIIIDEYDKPLSNAVFKRKDSALAKDISEVINNLFEEIKASFEYIAFVWITGVTRLPIPSLESSANNFINLSSDLGMTRVAGFTKSEIQNNFKFDIKRFADIRSVNEKKVMDLLQAYYDGYMFSARGLENVYNPISVISALRKCKIENYWTSTGSEKSIVEQIAKGRQKLEFYDNLRISETQIFQKYDILVSKPPLHIYMFQHGYLTIAKYEDGRCGLKLSNTEIRETLLNSLVSFIPSEGKSMETVTWFQNLHKLLVDRNVSAAIDIINRAGFQYYNAPLNSIVEEIEVTRRLIAMLSCFGILGDPLYGKVAKGDTDITTTQLPINYVIEVKCGVEKNQQISTAIEQLLKYVIKDEETRSSFLQSLGNPYEVYLLAIHVDHTSGGRIDEWVLIPYREGKLMVEEMETSSKELFESVVATVVLPRGLSKT